MSSSGVHPDRIPYSPSREKYVLPLSRSTVEGAQNSGNVVNVLPGQESYPQFNFGDSPINYRARYGSARTSSAPSEYYDDGTNPLQFIQSDDFSPSAHALQAAASPVDDSDNLSGPGDALPPNVVHRSLLRQCAFIPFPANLPTSNAQPYTPGTFALFIGQVRFETSPAELIWLIEHTCGVAPTHLEGRGSGCYLVFMKAQEELPLVHTLHKRILFDIGGAWYASNAEEAKNLNDYLANGAAPLSKKFRLPRDSMVVEELKERTTVSGGSQAHGNANERGGFSKNRKKQHQGGIGMIPPMLNGMNPNGMIPNLHNTVHQLPPSYFMDCQPSMPQPQGGYYPGPFGGPAPFFAAAPIPPMRSTPPVQVYHQKRKTKQSEEDSPS